MRGRLRTSVNWQGALKQKRIQETGVKEGIGVCRSFRSTHARAGWRELRDEEL
jgi:hypothetical protein